MKAIYTDADIITAGERLRSERPGGLVSPWDILKALGSRGKFERVERIWSTHIAEAAEVAEAPAVVEMPLPPRLAEARDADLDRVASSLEAVRGIVFSLYSSTWTVADEVAQSRVASERKTFADQRDEYERREALAREVQEAAELREEALKVRADGLDADLAKAVTTATQLTERLAAADTEAARSTERSRAEIARLTASLASAEAAAALARQEAAAAVATAAAAHADADRTRGDLTAVRNEMEALRRDLDAARSHGADLGSKLAAADARATGMAEALDLERTAKTLIEARATETAGQLTATTDRAARAEEQARGLEIKIGELRQLAAAAEVKLVAATDGLDRERDTRILAEGRAAEMSERLSAAEERAAALQAAQVGAGGVKASS